MKRLFFSTTLAAALALCAPSAFAGQRGGGHAAPRTTTGMHGGHFGGGHVVVAPYYYGGWYGPAYGWGYYDPLWDMGWGYGPYGYYGAPQAVTGGLRLEVKPTDAQVFVDGNYVGVVDDFDGHFQHVDLTPGGHRVEIRADGFAPLDFNAFIQPDHTTDYKGHLTPLS